MDDPPPSLRASAVIVAAGGAARMGFDKLLAPLGGIPVLLRTLRAFQECPEVGEIILVTGQDRAAIAESAGFSKLTAIVPGGAERHLSVWEGLLRCSQEYVAVHDAARPLVTPELISRCLRVAAEHGAATAARRITETVKRSDADGWVAENVDRANLWAMETPQCFRRSLLVAACRSAIDGQLSLTDEVSAVQLLGERVKLVESQQPNPKITFPADLAHAEKLLAS